MCRPCRVTRRSRLPRHAEFPARTGLRRAQPCSCNRRISPSCAACSTRRWAPMHRPSVGAARCTEPRGVHRPSRPDVPGEAVDRHHPGDLVPCEIDAQAPPWVAPPRIVLAVAVGRQFSLLPHDLEAAARLERQSHRPALSRGSLRGPALPAGYRDRLLALTPRYAPAVLTL